VTVGAIVDKIFWASRGRLFDVPVALFEAPSVHKIKAGAN